jgi:CheY-like chemotaxis protein
MGGYASAAIARGTPAVKSLRILLVEDHQATRDALAKLLGLRGHKVTGVASIEEAYTVAEKEKFELVISDLGLPDGSGNELMAGLRSRYGLKGIALSGYSQADDLNRSHEAGFVTHLTKPVSIGTLEKALQFATSPEGK